MLSVSGKAARLLGLISSGRLVDAEREASIQARTEQRAGVPQLVWILALAQQGRRREAIDIARTVTRLESESAAIDDALGTALSELRLHQDARTLYLRALQNAPHSRDILFNLATAERALGDLGAAETALNRVIELAPDDYPAYPLRSELRLQTDRDNHVAELGGLLVDSKVDARGRKFVAYALGKELDDLGQYAAAFRCFEKGARLCRQSFQYDVHRDTAKLARIAQEFGAVRITNTARTHPGGSFAFIVGLPRAGTTLVERMLLSHEGVRSNEETDNFMLALLKCTPQTLCGEHVDIFARAARANYDEVAAQYATMAGQRGFDGLILEKLPTNYLYVGAIHCALPNAPILWVHRSPLDHCFAMYRTLFGDAYPFSYDWQELAVYYAAFSRLMQHWQHLLNPPMHSVCYDKLVLDPESEGAAMARRCGLKWTSAALQFYRHESASTTASASQVRRPIYSSSVRRWKNYEAMLGPLVSALETQGIRDLS